MSTSATRMPVLVSLLLLLFWPGVSPTAALAKGLPADVQSSVHAVRILVNDLQREVDFYTEILGFERLPGESNDVEVVMTSGSLRVILTRLKEATAPAPRHVREQVTLNFFVGDLDATMTRWREASVEFHADQPHRISIGRAAAFEDPSGNILHVLEIEGRRATTEPQVFNLSLNVPDIDKAVDIYCHELGHEIFSLGYFPPTVPLRRRGGIALVMHEEPDLATGAVAPSAGLDAEEAGTVAAGIRVIFEVRDPAATLKRLVERGASRVATKGGRLFRDPAGIVHELRSLEAETRHP